MYSDSLKEKTDSHAKKSLDKLVDPKVKREILHSYANQQIDELAEKSKSVAIEYFRSSNTLFTAQYQREALIIYVCVMI